MGSICCTSKKKKKKKNNGISEVIEYFFFLISAKNFLVILIFSSQPWGEWNPIHKLVNKRIEKAPIHYSNEYKYIYKSIGHGLRTGIELHEI